MKSNSLTFAALVLVLTAVVILAPPALHAQGTLYYSNLGHFSTYTGDINNTSWIGQGVESGADSQGYVLNAVEVQMAAANGSPAGFTLSVFSAANGTPAQSLGILAGSSDPATAGLYTYTTSGITLAPDTEYFIIASATTTPAQGSYEWLETALATVEVDNWQGEDWANSANQGGTWTLGERTSFDTAIYATAVPEPPTWAFLLIGALFAMGKQGCIRISH